MIVFNDKKINVEILQRNMSFGAALIKIKNGGAVARKNWISEPKAIKLFSNKIIGNIFNNDKHVIHNYVLTTSDLLAEDWCLVNYKYL